MHDLSSIHNPSFEQLSFMDRDLQFSKVTNDNPSFLSEKQIASFNKDGYLMPFRGLSISDICELRGYFDRILEEVSSRGESSYSINTAHLKYPRIYDLIHNINIISPVKDLLGDDIVAWGAHFFCKMPHDGMRVPWHQDCIYWPLTPTKTVTVWLAVDDVDSSNAPMKFIPKSHLKGKLEFQELDKSREKAVLGLESSCPEFKTSGAVEVHLKAGEFSIHNDLLLHGSEPNTSQKRRCGLTLRYASTSVKPEFGWARKGVVVSGVDSFGHWENLPRPK